MPGRNPRYGAGGMADMWWKMLKSPFHTTTSAKRKRGDWLLITPQAKHIVHHQKSHRRRKGK